MLVGDTGGESICRREGAERGNKNYHGNHAGPPTWCGWAEAAGQRTDGANCLLLLGRGMAGGSIRRRGRGEGRDPTNARTNERTNERTTQYTKKISQTRNTPPTLGGTGLAQEYTGTATDHIDALDPSTMPHSSPPPPLYEQLFCKILLLQ